MLRPVLFATLLGLAACNNDDKKNKGVDETKEALGATFTGLTLPYQIADTSLAKITGPLVEPGLVSPLLADSLKAYFGKNASIKFTALGKASQAGKETYYVLGASAGNKKAALVLVYDKEEKFAAAFPLLMPDADPATAQASAIEKNFTFTKSVTLRNGAEIVGEGKDVVEYVPSSKSFSLIAQDQLVDNPAELVNPIDTLRKTHPLAGDYTVNKKNLVSVRDGRNASEITVFIHTENEAGDCIGQLKGEFILTSSTTAAYRQSGDPCVLGLTFSGNTVTMNEEQGCGNYRGLDCPLGGTFTRKKAQSPKAAAAKAKRK